MPENNPPVSSPRIKATYFENENKYGYAHAIVYNETIRTQTQPVVNTDVSALTKNLHSPEAMAFAADSLGDD